MYYSRHLVYFFVLPIGHGWEYHMLHLSRAVEMGHWTLLLEIIVSVGSSVLFSIDVLLHSP